MPKTRSETRTPKELRALLPWYLNDTLTPAEWSAVETWLGQDPDAPDELAAWRQMHRTVTRQSAQSPSPAVWQRVMAQVQDRPARQRGPVLPRLAWGMALAVAVLVTLWATLQPGMVLEWSAEGGQLTAFRVYRAPLGTADFGLLGEVPAEPEVQAYSYLDGRSWPGQAYVYLVEAVGAEGQVAAIQTIVVDGLQVLPVQALILLLRLLPGCGVAALAGRWHVPAWRGSGLLA